MPNWLTPHPPAWLFPSAGDAAETDTLPDAGTDTRPLGDTPADTDTGAPADTQPAPQSDTPADTHRPVSPARAGIARLPILAEDGRLSRADRFAARFNDMSEERRDLLWPYICLIGRARNGQPDSMATYRRYAHSGAWMHPATNGRGRRILYWTGRAYHAMWGHWVHKLGLSLAYAAPRPLRMLAWLLFTIPLYFASAFTIAVFIRFI
jgi:hypothetical protein